MYRQGAADRGVTLFSSAEVNHVRGVLQRTLSDAGCWRLPTTLQEARTAWRKRFGRLLAELRESAVTEMSDEELNAFIREEIQARRREQR
jgi:hypothetical protein